MDELVFPQGIKVEELTETSGKISIEPLERGFATTLGNSLRRVLLSAIPGSAVVRVRFAGKYHEYDTIDGVREDILEIILNFKSLSLRIKDDEMQRLTLTVKGPAVVTAADIVTPPGVEIINPDLHIATLSKVGELDVEVEVETGFGYVASEMNSLEDSPLSVIPIDADFSPVRRVDFHSEETRVGGKTGYERLVLEMATNGAIKPEEALSEASRILKRHIDLFNGFAEHPYGILVDEAEEVEAEELSISLIDLNIDQRACNLLQEADIVTLNDLLTRPREELLDIHGFGGKTLSKVEDRLEELGHSLKSEGDIRHEA
ncbi:DNA-directed RNA polymerase subunit alpha [Candidatus Bipolaricaulota bacterium]|jgi:DNA-directed RNA polymerase subunit alpha|nr:DNA-directed RNA polymerase subunit alpha [Candidatus Bipolaricaulota bacterium]